MLLALRTNIRIFCYFDCCVHMSGWFMSVEIETSDKIYKLSKNWILFIEGRPLFNANETLFFSALQTTLSRVTRIFHFELVSIFLQLILLLKVYTIGWFCSGQIKWKSVLPLYLFMTPAIFDEQIGFVLSVERASVMDLSVRMFF